MFEPPITKDTAIRLLNMVIDAGMDELAFKNVETWKWDWSIVVLDAGKRKGEFLNWNL